MQVSSCPCPCTAVRRVHLTVTHGRTTLHRGCGWWEQSTQDILHASNKKQALIGTIPRPGNAVSSIIFLAGGSDQSLQKTHLCSNQSGQSGNSRTSAETLFSDYPLVRRAKNTCPALVCIFGFVPCTVPRPPLVRDWPWTSPGSPEPVHIVWNRPGEEEDHQSGDKSGKLGLCSAPDRKCYRRQSCFGSAVQISMVQGL